jgi:hypothetical protein
VHVQARAGTGGLSFYGGYSGSVTTQLISTGIGITTNVRSGVGGWFE